MGYDVTAKFSSAQALNEVSMFLREQADLVAKICRTSGEVQDPTFYDAGGLAYGPDHEFGIGMHCIVVTPAVVSLVAWAACQSDYADRKGRPVAWIDEEAHAIDVGDRFTGAPIKVDDRGIRVEREKAMLSLVAQRLQGIDRSLEGRLLAQLNDAWQSKPRQTLRPGAMQRADTEEDVVDHRTVSDYVRHLHGRAQDFDDGDLQHRLDRFNEYVLRTIPISSLRLDEFDVDDVKVDEFVAMYKANKNVPPIVFDEIEGSIIDGVHRANALAKLGLTEIAAYVGTVEGLDPHWEADTDADDDLDEVDDHLPRSGLKP